MTIPKACRGSKLTVDALFATKRCETKEISLPPPPADALAIAVELGAKTVRPGGTVSVKLSMTNRTNDALALDLEGCGHLELRVYDAKGERADEPSNCFNAGTVCLLRHVRVALEPGGSITKQFSFRAQTKDPGELCRIRPPGPMDPGSYKLEIDLPFVERLQSQSSNSFTVRKASTELIVK